jgi:hypothetical protein
VSSQGDGAFAFSENPNPLLMKGSASNYSQDLEQSGIKTRYNNNRFIPGEAIEEEVENYPTNPPMHMEQHSSEHLIQ